MGFMTTDTPRQSFLIKVAAILGNLRMARQAIRETQ